MVLSLVVKIPPVPVSYLFSWARRFSTSYAWDSTLSGRINVHYHDQEYRKWRRRIGSQHGSLLSRELRSLIFTFTRHTIEAPTPGCNSKGILLNVLQSQKNGRVAVGK